jgi:cytochrome c biogenesis protein CcmG/thiol:disulfide interchange protein DsbE
VRNKGFIAIVAVVGFIGLLVFGLFAKSTDPPEVGDPVPDAALPVLGGSEQVALADYRGKWVLLNLWASWCEPCREEAPALERFSRRNSDDVVVLGIATDDRTDDALTFAEEYGITYPLLHDGPGARKDELGATGLPESYLVDPEGNLALHSIGAIDDEYIEANVMPLIEAGPASASTAGPGGDDA